MLDERHAAAQGGAGALRHGRAVPEDLPFRWRLEECEQPEQGAFSGAVVAHQTHNAVLGQAKLLDVEHHASFIPVPHLP